MSTRTLWLHMLREGGRWSIEELVAATEVPSAKFLVDNMIRTGSAVKYPRSDVQKRIRYGVTTACRVPTGVTLAELVAIGVVRQEGAS